MEALICERCGSNEFRNENGLKVCAYCETAYKAPAKPLDTSIDLQSDIRNLLMKCKSDPKNARRYANLILDIDPGNKEARRYL